MANTPKTAFSIEYWRLLEVAGLTHEKLADAGIGWSANSLKMIPSRPHDFTAMYEAVCCAMLETTLVSERDICELSRLRNEESIRQTGESSANGMPHIRVRSRPKLPIRVKEVRTSDLIVPSKLEILHSEFSLILETLNLSDSDLPQYLRLSKNEVDKILDDESLDDRFDAMCERLLELGVGKEAVYQLGTLRAEALTKNFATR